MESEFPVNRANSWSDSAASLSVSRMYPAISHKGHFDDIVNRLNDVEWVQAESSG